MKRIILFFTFYFLLSTFYCYSQTSGLRLDSVKIDKKMFIGTTDRKPFFDNVNSNNKLLRDNIDNILDFKHQEAIEQFAADIDDTGSPIDTVYSQLTSDVFWEHDGRVIRYLPSTYQTINNIGWQKYSTASLNANMTIIVKKSESLLSTNAAISALDTVTTFEITSTAWNNAGNNDFVYSYFSDLTLIPGYYYYFINYAPTEDVGVYAGTSSGTVDLFWYSGDWNITSNRNYVTVFRYNNMTYSIDIPTTSLSGTISENQISSDLLLDKIRINALENTGVTVVDYGTPGDTLYSLTAHDIDTWDFVGAVVRWQPSSTDTINNIGIMKGTEALTQDDTLYLKYSASLTTDETIINNMTTLRTFVLDMDEYNAVDTYQFIYSYFEDLTVNSSYYYYLVWGGADAPQALRRSAAPITDGIQDLFYLSSQWYTTSKDWCVIYRYNDDMIYQMNDNVEDVRLLLPDTIYMATGQEYNIYYDNLILTSDYHDYKYDVVCDSGAQYEQGWCWTPASGSEGNYTWEIEIYNWSNDKIAENSTTLKVGTGGTIGSVKTILMIGNSLTDHNIYPAEVYTLAGSNLTFLGTQDSGTDSKNEGYGGKTYSWFENDVSSPFVSGVGADISLQTYLTAQGYADPDYITIGLGTNDIFSGTHSVSTIGAILNYTDSLITNFLADAPNAQIGIFLITPPSYSQDAFGTNYDCGQTTWQFKRNQHLFNEQMKAKYGVGGTDYHINVSLIPVYLGLDTEHNMSTTSTQYNARNTDTYDRQTNGVHPANSGYYQIADYVFGWLINH